MAKAIWKNAILAQASDYEIVEGNIYFPPDTINKVCFKNSDTHTNCSWKGHASYYHIDVNGEINKDAAWFYPENKEKAKQIRDHIAFWRGVEVTE